MGDGYPMSCKNWGLLSYFSLILALLLKKQSHSYLAHIKTLQKFSRLKIKNLQQENSVLQKLSPIVNMCVRTGTRRCNLFHPAMLHTEDVVDKANTVST